ncbi:LPXTG cell wall anchor domain-containing protein [Enterococcus faecalis]|uniref:LPXTG cell wall anchor domain-containing protein n=1 Tax=Enterococcus faecalis TaxID=1351 RepID=UPI002810D071|nr:LPXTG cell wall anchor domain-containing protein [Enterococcus faecalis]
MNDKNNHLPKTGEEKNSFLVSVGGILILGILGMFGYKKRKKIKFYKKVNRKK